ncbi:MAG: penicillin-binding protein 2, partial [Clostridia bacterium]|nr:penicillin-binding protein 2 [Clostridia bacterium]
MLKKHINNGKNNYEYNFAARAATCYFLALLLLCTCVLRVAVINTRGYSAVAAEQSEYKIAVCRPRGTIYDCNLLPLTNNKKRILAVALPTSAAKVTVGAMLKNKEKENFLATLNSGKPAVCELPREIECEGVATTCVYSTVGTKTACHIVGYLDNTGHGAAGLEAAYDALLYDNACLYAVAEVDGKGRPLGGSSPKFMSETTAPACGVVSTIDIKMQNAVEKAASGIEKGAVVVSEVKTGEIKALLSLPQYDTGKISDYLNEDNSPFLNRALRTYSVGSVFKTCVAAAGLENKADGGKFNCTGREYIVDRYFKCHKADGHGEVGLRQALAFSCNCFFYNFAALLGGEVIYKTARKFNFGFGIKVADNMKTAAGTLPETATLKNPAQLANFSIGQGKFSASPISLLPLYTAVAGGGEYYLPHLVKSTIKDGKVTPYNKGNPTRAISKATADTLKEYLKDVIDSGTATAARPKTVNAAGKTATAQTGRVDKNGKKINNSWFCGFFPADEPEYAAVILSEGGNTAAT